MPVRLKLGLSVLVPLLLVVAAASLYRCDADHNRGYSFGYYGDFNRVSNALAKIPGITIKGAWANHDVTLEEFGFDILTESKQPVRLFFGEEDHIRDLSGDAMMNALKHKIRASNMNL